MRAKLQSSERTLRDDEVAQWRGGLLGRWRNWAEHSGHSLSLAPAQLFLFYLPAQQLSKFDQLISAERTLRYDDEYLGVREEGKDRFFLYPIYISGPVDFRVRLPRAEVKTLVGGSERYRRLCRRRTSKLGSCRKIRRPRKPKDPQYQEDI